MWIMGEKDKAERRLSCGQVGMLSLQGFPVLFYYKPFVVANSIVVLYSSILNIYMVSNKQILRKEI